MFKIAVTGVHGQVARSLAELAEDGGFELARLGRPEFDLARPDTAARALDAIAPDLVISAAAYTAVDQAEDEPDAAWAVNAAGPGALAKAAAELGAPVLHLSTDYVFSGSKGAPYVESDPTDPQSVYGASKLAGEDAILASGGRALVLRTSGVYAPFGANFVRTMLRLGADRDELRIVGDQHACFTYAPSLAAALLEVGRRFAAEPRRPNEVLHAAGSEEGTWAEFAEGIFAESSRRGGPTARVRPIPSTEYPTKARRPADSRLDGGRLEQSYGVGLPGWRTDMPKCVERLLRGAPVQA